MKRRISTRNLHNSSTRRKSNTLDLDDRISALPNSILGLILSHLPTKNAVATTILSKRWKFVWMTVHNLDFCLDEWKKKVAEDENMRFVQFVNRVFLLLDGGLLNKFRLLWRFGFIPSQVSSWITTAITRNVHHLFVSVWLKGEPFNPSNPFNRERFDNYKLLEMPANVFNAGSLQFLELNGSIFVPAEIVVSLPRLESLILDSVYFPSEEAFKNLICGCPKLNYLRIDLDDEYMTRYSKDYYAFRYIISSTSLRRLELCVEYSNDYFSRSLELEASSLEYLKIVGRIYEVFVEGSLSSLVEVDFRIDMCDHEYFEYNYDQHVETVRAFDCAKAITLSAAALWALGNGTICLSNKFTRLTKLKAGAHFCYSSSALQDFIQSSDCLEVLKIYQDSRTILDEYYHDPLNCSNCSNWTAPIEVPGCLSKSLKEVSFEGYAGLLHEREMIGYMLKNGSVLEVMEISCAGYKNKAKFELLKEISRFPRKSPACIVEFIE